MIGLKFDTAQYNSFIDDKERKVICKVDGRNPVTRLKEEIPRKVGTMQLSP